MTTWNPSDKSSNTALVNGDKRAQAISISNGGPANDVGVRGTIGHTTGRWYFEVLIERWTWHGKLGVARASDPLDTSIDHNGAVSFYFVNNGEPMGWSEPATMRFLVDLDQRRLFFQMQEWFGNEWFGYEAPTDPPPPGSITFPSNPGYKVPAGEVFPFFADKTNLGYPRSRATVRLTAADFAYPIPAGYTAWDGSETGSGSEPTGSTTIVAVAEAATSDPLRALLSGDGLTWTQQTAAVNNNTSGKSWKDVCWSPELGIFVAVSANTDHCVMTSPDGVTWTRRDTPNRSWRSVVWADTLGLFVAVAEGGTGNRVMTSPDGISWTLRASADDTRSYKGVAWLEGASSGDGILVACFDDGSSGAGFMTSPDGINWTARSSSPSRLWMSIAWSPELEIFCAVSRSNIVATSPDGINWTQHTSTLTGYEWWDITWSSAVGRFVACARNNFNVIVAYSSNGISWTQNDTISGSQAKGVAWSSVLGLYICCSRNAIHTSIDGITWTQRSSINGDWHAVVDAGLVPTDFPSSLSELPSISEDSGESNPLESGNSSEPPSETPSSEPPSSEPPSSEPPSSEPPSEPEEPPSSGNEEETLLQVQVNVICT